MKTKTLFVALLVVLLAALALVGVASAQDDNPPVPTTPYGGSRGFGGGRMGGALGQGWMHDYMIEAFADALGLSPEELQAQIDAGAHMFDIASEQGLSVEEFQQLMFEARDKALQQAVADGLIDQEWANWMIERMQGMYSGGFGPGGGGCHGGFGRGAGGRWNSLPVQPEGTSS